MRKKCNCPPGSPFHWQEIYRPSLLSSADLNKSLNNSLKQTEHIERERVKGRDISHVAGLSNNPSAQRIINVRQFVVYSKAGRVL